MENMYAKLAVFTFGRFNPPTTGHGLLFNEVMSMTKRESYVFTSLSNDPENNPLQVEEKIEMVKELYDIDMVPAKTFIEALAYLRDEYNYNEALLIIGADRYKEFNALAEYYSYHIDEKKRLPIPMKVRLFERNDDVSATAARSAVIENDLEKYSLLVDGDAAYKRKTFDLLRRRINGEL